MTESTQPTKEGDASDDDEATVGFERPPSVQARDAITTHADEFQLSKQELVERVVDIVEDATTEIVHEELERLQLQGEVYFVGDGDEAEVRRT